MGDIQKTTDSSGEITQRFIEFVMMHAQNAALFLGQIPHPQGGEREVNLDLARLFIDQLVMIREKTRGNLGADEQAVLNNAITNLQMVFFEVSQQKGAPGAAPAAPDPAPAPARDEEPETELVPPEGAVETGAAEENESKKRFTKSYGA